MSEEITKKRILVAEDEPPLLMMLCDNLQDAGYEVIRATDGEEALILAFRYHPDLVITDVLMPRKNGNELIKALREQEATEKIPIIVLTGRGLMRDYFEAMKINRFVEKPFQTSELLTAIEEVFKSNEIVESSLETPEVSSPKAPEKSS